MNKLFKTLSIVVLVVIVAGAFAQARRASAAPNSLPYRLTMNSVEQKLGQPTVTFAPQAGWQDGVPDEGGSPDHIHYWAIYKRFGVTVVYNSPSAADKNATIYKILVSK